MLSQTHVLQHHDGAEQKSSGVGKALASNIRSRAVDGFEDRALVTNVTRGSETKTTNQTGAHVGQNITVQVGHDQDLVVVGHRVGDDLEARVVQQLRIKLDIRELFGDLAGGVQEKAVGHLHDRGLVHNADLLLVDRAGVLEREAQHSLGSLLGDKLDALHHTVHDHVLNPGILALGVLTDQDSVDIIVGSLVASDGSTRANVGEEVESATEGQVEGDVTLANGSLAF